MSKDKNILAEKLIRGMVRKAIMHIREKRKTNEAEEETLLRETIQKMILLEILFHQINLLL